MIINHTIKEIAQLFADNGYIISDGDILHYNYNLHSFDLISDVDVMEMFRRLYPNFERRELKLEMITEHLPRVSNKDFNTFQLCKKVENTAYDEDQLKKQIKKIINENDTRKKETPGKFRGDDYGVCTQFLINSNIFTDVSRLYQYKDGDFIDFDYFAFKKLLNPHLENKMTDKDYFKIYYLSKVALTDMSDLSQGLEIRQLINDLTREDWQTYERITEIANKAMEVQGVYENEYPVCME